MTHFDTTNNWIMLHRKQMTSTWYYLFMNLCTLNVHFSIYIGRSLLFSQEILKRMDQMVLKKNHFICIDLSNLTAC